MSDMPQTMNQATNLRIIRIQPDVRRECRSSLLESASRQELRKGRVTALKDGAFLVELRDGGEIIRAQRAAGCLLDPLERDIVLVLWDAEQEHYLLNVLARESTERSMAFPGDLQLRAPHGSCRIQARDLNLAAADRTRLSGEKLDVQAAQGTMRFGGLEIMAAAVHAGVDRIRTACRRMQLTCAHAVARVGRSIRSTGHELHRAHSLRMEVDDRFAVKAENASILAKEDMTLDAGRINLG